MPVRTVGRGAAGVAGSAPVRGAPAGERDISEALDGASDLAAMDQTSAGVDIVTDGEMRRRDFIQGFYGLLTRLERLPPLRTYGPAGYDQNPRYRVVGPITAPDGLGTVAEARYLWGARRCRSRCVLPRHDYFHSAA